MIKRNDSNKRRIAVIVGVIVLCLFVINEIAGYSIIKKVIYPLLESTSSVVDKASGFVDEKYIHDEKEMKIKELEASNAKLRKKLIESTINEKEIQELNELKKLLNYKEEKIYKNHVTAELISKDGNDFYTAFLVSAGSSDGIKKGDLVLSGNGLAGVVQSVQPDYSKVLSILDSQISMSFKAVRSETINGIASQNIDSDVFKDAQIGFLKGYVFDNGEILVGDIITTSGMGIYPKGIEIGEVHQVFEDKTNLLKYILIKPYTNFNSLSKLMVIDTREIEE